MSSPSRIVDLSRPLERGMPLFPGYVPVEVAQLAASDPQRDPVGTMHSSRISFGLHAGTHLDAPRHFAPAGLAIDAVPLEACAGPAVLVRVPEAGARGEITRPDLEPFAEAIRAARRIVLHTGWGARWGQPEYFAAYPVVTADAARFLCECGVLLVGLDTPSLDHEPFPSHIILPGSGVVVLENLANLDRIRSNAFTLIAAPLPLAGCEASPVRALALED